MPDIQMRFNKDMLVLSSPIEAVLARQGADVEHDLEYLLLVEPDALRDIERMESIAGVQCFVAATGNITPARLAQRNMDDRGADVAAAALSVVREFKPQHVLAEIAPCGLPLDGSNADSLNENRAQYARAARAFEGQQIDAFLLNGFKRPDDLKCALMGIAQASDVPVFASVAVDGNGKLPDGRTTLEEAVALMQEFGAEVAGFECGAPLQVLHALAKRAAAACDVPLLVQVRVNERNPKQGQATPDNPYYCPDTMVEAAVVLRSAGVQFLRAVGDASPAYSGALVAATMGFDVVAPAAAEDN